MTCVRSEGGALGPVPGLRPVRAGLRAWHVAGASGPPIGVPPFRVVGLDGCCLMATITKKELIDRIAEGSDLRRVQVKRIIQRFLDEIVDELGNGNRLEFRDFGVFESKVRAARMAQNPKTLEQVPVPPKRTVKFKIGRLMKARLSDNSDSFDPATGLSYDDENGEDDD